MPQTIDNLLATWNNAGTTFTAFKFNITDTASNAASLLMDLQVGGSSRFYVRKDGATVIGGSSASLYAGTIGISTLGPGLLTFGSSLDTILSRRAAANLRFGAADAAAPVAQTLSVQSVVAGTTNTAGANLTITGSQGTGTGAGGSIIFQVAPAGSSGSAQNALATALTIAGNREATFATNVTASGNILAQGGCLQFGIGVVAGSLNRIGFSSTANAYDVPDTTLFRDAANTLALRNGANAQAFRVYGSYTDGSNNDYLEFTKAAGGVARIRAVANGTGANTYLYLNDKWQIDGPAGHFLAITDNTYDIGASGANRPRSIYFGTSIRGSGFIEAGSGSGIVWSGRSQLTSSTDGNIMLSNNLLTDFGRLQFGGTTSSFPALKRSSTTLQARLADDSAFAPVQGKLTTDTAYAAGAPTATGYIVLYDSTGTAYKIPAVAV